MQKTKKQQPKIETLLKELEGIVGDLESNSVSLDKGIELFERGVGVTRECLASLSDSKGKITIIKEELDKLVEEEYLEYNNRVLYQKEDNYNV